MVQIKHEKRGVKPDYPFLFISHMVQIKQATEEEALKELNLLYIPYGSNKTPFYLPMIIPLDLLYIPYGSNKTQAVPVRYLTIGLTLYPIWFK